MPDYPKFQLSKFLAGSRDYQIVVRTDDAKELIKAMTEIKDFVQQIENKQQTPKQAQNEAPSGLKAMCNLHHVEMVGREGKFGQFWSHKYIDPQGNEFWCDGKKMKPVKK